MSSASGSALAVPSSATAAPGATAWSGPAFATGGGFGGSWGLTVTFTCAGAELALASVTTSEKVRSTCVDPNGTTGAVKVGLGTAASESVTRGPAVCVQAKLSGSPAGSVLPLPSSVTKAPEGTAWSRPAFATGGGGGAGLTVMVTLAGAELPFASLTTSEKTSVTGAALKGTVGAVKVGLAVAAPESVTGTPDDCDHANVRGSAELLALPSSVTSAPEATVWSGPALATGSGGSGFTVMVTVDGAELRFASVTTRAKTRTPAGCPAGMVGAVKLGFTVLAPSSVTRGPETWLQAKEMGRPAGSLLALPSRVTSAPDATVWLGPALAMGACGGGGSGSTVMVTLEGAEVAFASWTT